MRLRHRYTGKRRLPAGEVPPELDLTVALAKVPASEVPTYRPVDITETRADLPVIRPVVTDTALDRELLTGMREDYLRPARDGGLPIWRSVVKAHPAEDKWAIHRLAMRAPRTGGNQ